MGLLSRRNRKSQSRARRNKLRHSSSELAIEMAEPRLLLSANFTANTQQAAVVGALQASVQGHLENLLQNVVANDPHFQLALPLLPNIAGASAGLANIQDAASAAHGPLLNLQTQIDATINAGLNDLIAAGNLNSFGDTSALANAIKAKIEHYTGNNTVSFTDTSSNDQGRDHNGVLMFDGSHHAIDFPNVNLQFSIALPQLHTSFTLDLNPALKNAGIPLNAPITQGDFFINETIGFNPTLDFAINADQGGGAFALNNPTATTDFHAHASIGAEVINFGLLTLATPGATLDYQGNVAVSFTGDFSGGPDNASPSSVTNGTDTNHALSLVLPLQLTSDILSIPGFSSITNGNLTITGQAFVDNTFAVQFNNFGTLNNLAEMSPTDLLNTFLTVSGYINQLTQSNLLNIEFPLTNGATIGQVINFASEFGTDVLTKLGSVQDMIGINHAAQSATAGSAGGTAVVELTPGDFSHLPQNFDIVLQVDGKILDFHLTPPTVSGNGAASDLSTELNALLPSVLTAAGINPNDPNDFFHNVLTIAANGSHVDFTAKATGDTHNFANISIQTPGTSFTTLPTFAENLAFALGYGGVASTLQSLAAGIGLQYDGGSSTLQFQLNYSTALPASLNSLGFDGAHRIAADDGSGHIVVAAQATVADFTSAFSFNLVINGHNREIDVAADLSRSTADAVATAIQNALNAILVNPTDLGLAAGNSFTLGSKITVTADGNHHVTFTATTSALTPANITTTPLLALADVHAENFSVGFDLGSLGGLAVSNGSFSFDATAGISMTIDVKIPPANQTAVTTGTELDLIPIWPTGGSITADQANNPVVVARSDIGLGGVFNGPSAATVEPIGDFIQASVSGTNLVLSALVTNATSSIAPASGQAATLSIVDAGAVSSSTQGGIADLGFAGKASSNDGTHITLTSGAISDVTKEFIFSLVVNGHAVKVDVPRDTGRASVGDLVIAINHALGAA
ncbi:MAG: hypothetical protein JO000_18245, partial [Alphaproteobacteria bacterium]|nr:hypothetical protein [Alphaproteobacteria bacterium]